MLNRLRIIKDRIEPVYLRPYLGAGVRVKLNPTFFQTLVIICERIYSGITILELKNLTRVQTFQNNMVYIKSF
jgi:hypothetical protein